jgi:hypothetical protein
MTDLEIAKSELYEENLTLAIVKKSELLCSTKNHPIIGFLDAIERKGGNLEDASVAGRVVGEALAFLCVHAKMKEVYASVMSRKALGVLRKHGIGYHWNELVESIPDSEKADMFLFEKAVGNLRDPEKAYKAISGVAKNLAAAEPAHERFISKQPKNYNGDSYGQ